MSMRGMETLEKIIGYTFKQPELLRTAFTHGSLRYEKTSRLPDNQRLEFLGDAVLQLVVSDVIYHRLDSTDEGGMTKLRATLVSAKALARVARANNFGKFLLMGRSEEVSGGRERESSLADVVEAMLGAVFLDGGFQAATQVVRHLFTDLVNEKERMLASDDGNPKGRLQEIVQVDTHLLPEYEITSEFGPDHNKRFQASVSWNGLVLGKGAGRTKRDAEAEAARIAIEYPELTKIVAAYAASRPRVEKAE